MQYYSTCNRLINIQQPNILFCFVCMFRDTAGKLIVNTGNIWWWPNCKTQYFDSTTTQYLKPTIKHKRMQLITLITEATKSAADAGCRRRQAARQPEIGSPCRKLFVFLTVLVKFNGTDRLKIPVGEIKVRVASAKCAIGGGLRSVVSFRKAAAQCGHVVWLIDPGGSNCTDNGSGSGATGVIRDGNDGTAN